MAILHRIRQMRVENDNLSQAQLAKQIDISRQMLNAIERGQRLPSLEVAHRIADPLECSLDDVFRYESEFPGKVDDGQLTIIASFDDEGDWWKSDDVSRVTTKA